MNANFLFATTTSLCESEEKRSDQKRGRCAVHVHRSFACELVVVVGAGAAGIIVAFVVLVVVVVGSVFFFVFIFL